MIPARYFLQCDFGPRGRESIIDYEDCSKETIILNILRREYGGRLMEVFCWEPDDNLCTNVSEDMARELFDRIIDQPHDDLIDFLEIKLGLVRGVS
jgi:hypothetical protein